MRLVPDRRAQTQHFRPERREPRHRDVVVVVARRCLVAAKFVRRQGGLHRPHPRQSVSNRGCEPFDVTKRVADAERQIRIFVQAGIARERPAGAERLAVEVRHGPEREKGFRILPLTPPRDGKRLSTAYTPDEPSR